MQWIAVALMFSHVLCMKRANEVVDYVADITRALEQRYAGTFICWLLQFSVETDPKTMRNLFARKLSTERKITLLQADMEAAYDSSYPVPNVVAIFSDTFNEALDVAIVKTWMEAIPNEAVVFVLFKTTMFPAITAVAANFASYGVMNLIMLPTNQDSFYTFRYAPLRPVLHVGKPSLDALLYDRLSTLEIKELSASYVKDIYVTPIQGELGGEDMNLFKLYFEKLGITLLLEEPSCDDLQTYVDCLAHSNDGVHINRFTSTRYSSQLVDVIELDKDVIFVPRGASIAVGKLLLRPFEQGVWVLLAFIWLIFTLLHHCAPTLIQNNLFLLALVGYERRNLRLSGSCEKVLAAALIMLVFQLQCAYETKLISYMIERPTEPNPRTIEDLRQSNLQVVVNRKVMDPDELRGPLAGIMLESDNQPFELKDKAFVANMYGLQLAFLDAINIDPSNGKPRYIMLEETLGQRLAFYYFPKKSVLKRGFAKFRRAVFEAGLQQHWRATLVAFLDHRRKAIIDKIADQDIHIHTLGPMLICFSFLWLIALGVFFCEHAFQRCHSREDGQAAD